MNMVAVSIVPLAFNEYFDYVKDNWNFLLYTIII